MTTNDILNFRTTDYDDNTERHDGESCHICGRKVNLKTAAWVEMLTSGELVDDDDPRAAGPESQGMFPVGPECRKKLAHLLSGWKPKP